MFCYLIKDEVSKSTIRAFNNDISSLNNRTNIYSSFELKTSPSPEYASDPPTEINLSNLDQIDSSKKKRNSTNSSNFSLSKSQAFSDNEVGDDHKYDLETPDEFINPVDKQIMFHITSSSLNSANKNHNQHHHQNHSKKAGISARNSRLANSGSNSDHEYTKDDLGLNRLDHNDDEGGYDDDDEDDSESDVSEEEEDDERGDDDNDEDEDSNVNNFSRSAFKKTLKRSNKLNRVGLDTSRMSIKKKTYLI